MGRLSWRNVWHQCISTTHTLLPKQVFIIVTNEMTILITHTKYIYSLQAKCDNRKNKCWNTCTSHHPFWHWKYVNCAPISVSNECWLTCENTSFLSGVSWSILTASCCCVSCEASNVVESCCSSLELPRNDPLHVSHPKSLIVNADNCNLFDKLVSTWCITCQCQLCISSLICYSVKGHWLQPPDKRTIL